MLKEASDLREGNISVFQNIKEHQVEEVPAGLSSSNFNCEFELEEVMRYDKTAGSRILQEVTKCKCA